VYSFSDISDDEVVLGVTIVAWWICFC